MFTRHDNFPGGGGGESLGTSYAFIIIIYAIYDKPLPHYSAFLVYSAADYRPHLIHSCANDFPTPKVLQKFDPILLKIPVNEYMYDFILNGRST